MRKMPPAIRKRLSYANVAATLALVFSMTGGALAAKHYLISSTKQISPKVLKKLHGANGRKGATGATGPAGARGETGAPGAKGEAGPFPTGNLPRGITLRGAYAVGGEAAGTGKTFTTAISFGYQLASPPAGHFLTEGASSTTECPGSPEEPKAAPGNLCVYETTGVGSFTVELLDTSSGRAETNVWGSGLIIDSAFAGHIESYGTWAVTSP